MVKAPEVVRAAAQCCSQGLPSPADATPQPVKLEHLTPSHTQPGTQAAHLALMVQHHSLPSHPCSW